MVTVEANGKQELLSIKIDREVINPDDAQMLEDLVIAACNEALRKSREMVQAEMGKLPRASRSPASALIPRAWPTTPSRSRGSSRPFSACPASDPRRPSA